MSLHSLSLFLPGVSTVADTVMKALALSSEKFLPRLARAWLGCGVSPGTGGPTLVPFPVRAHVPDAGQGTCSVADAISTLGASHGCFYLFLALPLSEIGKKAYLEKLNKFIC